MTVPDSFPGTMRSALAATMAPRLLLGGELVVPDTRGVDDQTRSQVVRLVRVPRSDHCAHGLAVLPQDLGCSRVTHHRGAVLLGGHGVRDRETSVVGRSVVIDRASRESNALQTRFSVQDPAKVESGMPARASSRHEMVGKEANAQPKPSDTRAAIHRPGKGKRLDDVRRDSQQRLALPYRLANEMKLSVLQISNPAVNEARRTARSATREVVALDQRDPEPAHGGVARHTAAGNPAADHEQIEFFCEEFSHSLLMSGGGVTDQESIRNLTARFGYRASPRPGIIRHEERNGAVLPVRK